MALAVRAHLAKGPVGDRRLADLARPPLALRNLKNLVNIEDGIFDDMNQLRTIVIHSAPNLKVISSLLFDVYLPSLKILEIVQTGIKKPPFLSLLRTNQHLRIVDLESNRIEKVIPGELSISAEQL
ncbi:PREDICTED: uncharacterized protein LOC107166315 [Diuraphis noxia]|uniref:uncharacterized protein LOC107166315 n=1 Tax=Diuraphis noxia TaxID=143948 RepID=UPI0007636341|nr:PREDICTED: uncharacterized protein LOC107166315 [Diuraphis noxia]